MKSNKKSRCMACNKLVTMVIQTARHPFNSDDGISTVGVCRACERRINHAYFEASKFFNTMVHEVYSVGTTKPKQKETK